MTSKLASPGGTARRLPGISAASPDLLKLLFHPSLTIGIGLALLALAVWRNRDFLPDDPMISLRYARHLIENGALEWNLGERVEGYTNFLHVMLSAALMWIGFEPIFSARLVNAAAAAVLIVSCWIGAQQLTSREDGREVAGIAMLGVLASAPLGMWIVGGLEGPLVAALQAAGLAALLASRDGQHRPYLLLAGICFGLAVLTRPDAAVIAGALILGAAVTGSGSWRQRIVTIAPAVLVCGTIVAIHLAWRYAYYGEFVPNTFYTKVGVPLAIRFPNALLYLRELIVQMPMVIVALAFYALALVDRTANRTMAMLAAAIGLHITYVLWAGGDHMPGVRMFLPLLGLVAMLIVATLATATGNQRLIRASICALVAIVAAVIAKPETGDPATFVGRLIGKHLAASEKPGTLVALSTAGSVPYHAPQLRFVDMLGLTDPTIARRNPLPIVMHWQRLPGHAKGDGAYVLSRKPALIFFGPAEGTTADNPRFLSDKEIVEHPEFARCYRKETASIPYTAADQGSAPARPNPLVVIMYRRHCPV